MKLIFGSVMILLAISDGARSQTSSPSTSGLPGAWTLLSVETIRPNGEIIYPFYGKKPEGTLLYDASGWMSIQIVSDPKPTVPKSDTREGFRASAPRERAAAADGYYAYTGTYSVDGGDSTVTHHAKESLYPAERDQDFKRHYSIDGDRLTLIAAVHEMGEDHQRRLTFERLHDHAVSTAVQKDEDPTVVASKAYKVVLENDQVRVLSFHAGPGANWALHAHPNAVVISLNDYQVKNAIPGHDPTVRSAKRGDALWIPARSHTGENVGSTDMDCVLVELKTAVSKRP